MRVSMLAVLLGVALSGSASADFATRSDVRAYVEELAQTEGFSKEELMRVFGATQRDQRVIDAMERPAEKTKPWYEYRGIFVTRDRIEQGVEFWRDNAAALERASQVYSVAPEVVVSIIGVETRYGRHAGNFRVVDSLSTLAFDYPPRSAFFRKELTQLLLLAREEKKDPLDLKGSYAGAMGYGQFMPSSYRAYAVDFDADGYRDIWNNPVDAIGSVANYFSQHGWQHAGPVVVPAAIDAPTADGAANQGLKPSHKVSELRALGVEVSQVAGDADAGLLRMDGEVGPEYWLALHNFYVITKYNRSPMYALAVHQLSEAIAQAREEVAQSTTADPARTALRAPASAQPIVNGGAG
jgi:membrane-bound lytic murein transglycosylase B